MCKFLILVDRTGDCKIPIDRYIPFLHILPYILMGFEPVDWFEKIREELIPIVLPELLYDFMAGGDLGTNKIEERVVHIE